jgi:nitrite reductase/ring-hydroxylating ferredoxin subunit
MGKSSHILSTIMKAVCLLVMIVCCFGCGKTDNSYVPDVPVNFQAPLSDPRLSALSITGGAVVINGYGVSGLIIYHSPAGGYVAYDRCSAYEPQNRCAVTLDNPTFTVTDPCSGSKFSLTDGSPVKAPATKSLKMYGVSVNFNEIFVSN